MKDAVTKARKFSADLYADELTSDMALEEIVFDQRKHWWNR